MKAGRGTPGEAQEPCSRGRRTADTLNVWTLSSGPPIPEKAISAAPSGLFSLITIYSVNTQWMVFGVTNPFNKPALVCRVSRGGGLF